MDAQNTMSVIVVLIMMTSGVWHIRNVFLNIQEMASTTHPIGARHQRHL
jgi:hypothetical protein